LASDDQFLVLAPSRCTPSIYGERKMTSEDQWSTDELEAAVEAYAEMYRAGQEGAR
jgi:hypothetical protein